MFGTCIRRAAWLAMIALIVGGSGIALAERPNGSYPPMHVEDEPLFGGHFEIDEAAGGGTVRGQFVIKGNGEIAGDFDFDFPGCAFRWAPITGSSKEWKSVLRLKMNGPIDGVCSGFGIDGSAKMKGEVDSSGDFAGTITVKICIQGYCETTKQPFFFELGEEGDGPWDLVIEDVVRVGKTPAGLKELSGTCTLKLDGSARGDWLEFDLAGTYNKVTDTSKIKCSGTGAFSRGAKLKVKDLVVSGGEVRSGRIRGTAFGRNINTRVP